MRLKLVRWTSIYTQTLADIRLSAVWVYDRNEVWFTSSVQVIEAGQSTQIYHYNLLKNSITHVTPSVDVVNPNGGYYFDGLVYFTTSGNSSVAPSVVSIDPTTYKTEIILNSYFGLPFNFIDDIAIVCCTDSESTSAS